MVYGITREAATVLPSLLPARMSEATDPGNRAGLIARQQAWVHEAQALSDLPLSSPAGQDGVAAPEFASPEWLGWQFEHIAYEDIFGDPGGVERARAFVCPLRTPQVVAHTEDSVTFAQLPGPVCMRPQLSTTRPGPPPGSRR